MTGWLRPLFSFRKYLLAEIILKECCGSYGWAFNSPNEAPFLTDRQYPKVFVVANFLSTRKIAEDVRVMEAIDLLKENGHVTVYENRNLHEMYITCTKQGERAFNDGFYKKQVYKFVAGLIGISGGAAGIVLLIRQWLK